MSRSRLEELLSAELDHDLSEDEREELQQLLETSQDAANARRSYKKLDQMLRDLPEQLLPASLHQRIVSGVRLPAAVADSKVSWFGSLWQSPVTRFSFAAAAGVLLSLAVFNAGGPNMIESPNSEMLGSMVPTHGNGSQVIDQLQVSGLGFASGAALLQRDHGLVLSIDLDAANPVDILVDLGQSGLRFDTPIDADGNLDILTSEPGELRLRGAGQHDVQISLSREGSATAAATATIELEFSSAGHKPQRGSLKLAH